MERLDRATDVVALLTEHSIGRPWLLYEAGVAKGKLDRTVFGLAIGVPLSQAIVGPFGQFQNSGDDQDSLTKLVLQLIRRNPDAAPREEAVRRQVIAFREETEAILGARKQGTREQQAIPDEGGVAKLFEEVKAMVGQLPEQIEGTVSTHLRRTSGSRKRRLHPGFIDELLLSNRDSDPKEQMTGVLVAASIIREDLPWIYDVLSELYRAVLRGDRRTSEAIFRSLMRTYESRHIRYAMGESVGREHERIVYFMLDRIPEVVERAIALMPTRLAVAGSRRAEGQMMLPTEPNGSISKA